MESFEKPTACPSALPVVTHGALRTGTWTAYGLGLEPAAAAVSLCTPRPIETQGTGLSVAFRNRTSIAPMAAVKGSALLPNSDVVDVDGLAGFRSWSPPV